MISHTKSTNLIIWVLIRVVIAEVQISNGDLIGDDILSCDCTQSATSLLSLQDFLCLLRLMDEFL